MLRRICSANFRHLKATEAKCHRPLLSLSSWKRITVNAQTFWILRLKMVSLHVGTIDLLLQTFLRLTVELIHLCESILQVVSPLDSTPVTTVSCICPQRVNPASLIVAFGNRLLYDGFVIDPARCISDKNLPNVRYDIMQSAWWANANRLWRWSGSNVGAYQLS